MHVRTTHYTPIPSGFVMKI